MNLDVENWKAFTIGKLFKLENGKANQGMLEDGNECFYVGAKKDDNGVMVHCAKDEALLQKGNCIIFICNGQGSVGYANYMDVDFIGTTDIVAGYNENLNEYNGLFIATVLCQERPKYSFGRKWKTHLRNTEIKLPIKYNPDGTHYFDASKKYSETGYVPDWEWMENYIKTLHHKPLTTKNTTKTIMNLSSDSWEYFLLKDICSITMGNKMDYSAMSMDDPSVNFVGRSADNNGVAGKVDFVADDNGNIIDPYKAGCITVALGGSLGSSYLQVEDFYTSQNVSVLEFEKAVSDPAKIFITTCIMNESKYKYFPFGRELNTHIRTDFGFTLPIQRNANGNPIIDDTHKYSEDGYIPDWEWMENYIKSLPYGDRL
ncbi:MAG: restriction endonuclease subunit S [Oscillospiraceae bacterium]|nr:restriction endonuclease subunit S [Oscillospiraceae bacterium]